MAQFKEKGGLILAAGTDVVRDIAIVLKDGRAPTDHVRTTLERVLDHMERYLPESTNVILLASGDKTKEREIVVGKGEGRTLSARGVSGEKGYLGVQVNDQLTLEHFSFRIPNRVRPARVDIAIKHDISGARISIVKLREETTRADHLEGVFIDGVGAEKHFKYDDLSSRLTGVRTSLFKLMENQ